MKKVLFPILAVVLAVGLGLPMAVAPVVGSPAYIETIYLSDSGPITDPPWTTYIYEVKLIDGATPSENRAELWPLPKATNLLPLLDFGEIPFNTVDAIACTPDGTTIYAIEKGSTKLGYWDLTLNEWYEVGPVTGTRIPECVLAAFDSNGVLYAASDSTDSLYTVDLSSGLGIVIGPIKYGGVTVNVSGADLVWGSGPTLYLWANAIGAPKGLYTLTVPGSPGPVTASYIGGSAYPSFYTGLAIRGGGAGDLIGSNTTDDAIVQIDKTTGMPVTDKTYPMYDEDTATRHDYGYGDLTIGELEVENPPRIDIKPTSCPNPLNVKSKGVLPVAILGTEGFDVTQVDVSTVLLEGVAPLRYDYEDVATPFVGDLVDCSSCTTAGPDGFPDLTLKFDTQEIVDMLDPADVVDGACLVLSLTGNLKEEFSGTAFTGEDVVRIIKKSGKK